MSIFCVYPRSASSLSGCMDSWLSDTAALHVCTPVAVTCISLFDNECHWELSTCTATFSRTYADIMAAGVFHGRGVCNRPSSGQRGGGKPSVAGPPGARPPPGRRLVPPEAQPRRCALPGDVGRTAVGYCPAGPSLGWQGMMCSDTPGIVVCFMSSFAIGESSLLWCPSGFDDEERACLCRGVPVCLSTPGE